MTDINESERLRYPAPYAALSKDSLGRGYNIPPNPYRTEYQRDRDRIIHSTAFRRLQHKTQVFANLGGAGDHYRTRLTHTIEVAQISRTIARSLGLNEDLAEAVALAHDLGHTPFGHAGENILNDLMADHGGFNHNHQSLRVVDYLEKRYPDHYGLNLTFELREAIIKHESDHGLTVPAEFKPGENPLLEGQLVNLADEIAYSGHDIDDGLASGLLTLDQLRDSDFLKAIIGKTESEMKEASGLMIRHAVVRTVVNTMILDLVAEIDRLLKANNIHAVEGVRTVRARLMDFSPEQTALNNKLKLFLRTNMYNHPTLMAMKERSAEIMTFLFNYYQDNFGDIPNDFRRRYPDQLPQRLISDYIAGMTDRFAQHEFSRLRQA
jgi:dGTPase